MVKKKSEKTVEKEERGVIHGDYNCKIFSLKLASMAFILFLITAWDGLGNALLSVHWGIYLAIFLLLVIVVMTKYCKKK